MLDFWNSIAVAEFNKYTLLTALHDKWHISEKFVRWEAKIRQCWLLVSNFLSLCALETWLIHTETCFVSVYLSLAWSHTTITYWGKFMKTAHSLSLLPHLLSHCNCVVQMEEVIARMQDEKNGIPIRTVKSFLTKIPSVFSGKALISLLCCVPLSSLLLFSPLFSSPFFSSPLGSHPLSTRLVLCSC